MNIRERVVSSGGRLASFFVCSSVALSVGATDRYVSSDGSYGSDVEGAVCYTDLWQAVKDAQDNETVWVKDGFVYEAENDRSKTVDWNGAKATLVMNKAFLLRSESGTCENGGGATLRGAPDPTTGNLGGNAICCVAPNKAGAVVKGFYLENGYTTTYSAGGAVNGVAGTAVEDCVIRNSKAQSGGGAGGAGVFRRCLFTSNTATASGGGAYNCSCYGCTFTGNSAASGGGYASQGADSVLSNCTIKANTVIAGTGKGGAFYKGGSGTLTVRDSFVTDSSASDFGGAISIYNATDDVLIYDTLIANNTGAGNRSGGALFASSTANVMLDHCTITNNTGVNGGFFFGKTLFATNCTIAANKAGSGGAARLDNTVSDAHARFSDCRILDNEGTTNAGAVYDEKGVVSFEHCTIAGNKAPNYGGVYGGASYDTCTISNNQATGTTGGLYLTTDGAVVSNCTIIANTATGDAGGLRSIGGGKKPLIVDTKILDNTAGSNGGGAYTPDARLVRVTISGNKAVIHGGGVFCGTDAAHRGNLSYCTVSNNVGAYTGRTGCQGGGATMIVADHTTFVGNTTCGSGGGTYNGILSDCVVRGNWITSTTSGGVGGGLYLGAATNTVICGNTAYKNANRDDAGRAGGAFKPTALVGCQIFDNHSEYKGGAVQMENTYVANCVISNNTAALSGSGLFGTGEAYNCLIVGNVITNAAGGGCAAGAEGISASTPMKLVNCTVADNWTAAGRGCMYVDLLNSIIWGNAGSVADQVVSGSYSCAAALTDGVDGNITSDPKLRTGYLLKANSPCRNAGTPQTWMSDENDVRSKDIYGRARLTADNPSMGAAEYVSLGGLMLLLR